MGVSGTIHETCRTDFVPLIIREHNEIFLSEASTCFFLFFFLNSSIMYIALQQSKYGHTKLNKDNLYCELKGQNMVDCYN